MIRSVAGFTVAASDPDATRAAWERLGVALPVTVVDQREGRTAGLVEVGLVVSDEGVSHAAALLARRGADVTDDVVDLAGVRWRLVDSAASPSVATGLALDHVVVSASDPVRAAADYGARLGLNLRLDTATGYGFRGLFFRCGEAVVEVVVADDESRRLDGYSGLAWRCADIAAERERLIASGVDVSEVRDGRKPGTAVATVRNPELHVPTLLVAQWG